MIKESIMMKKTGLAVAAVLTAALLAGCSGAQQVSDVDIIIAGKDPAGMAAAIQAADKGTDPSRILVVGGSKWMVYGEEKSMNAAGTEEQAEAGIQDSADLYAEDTMKAGGENNNPEMVRRLAEGSRDALEWVKALGVDLTGVTQESGSSVARSYEAADGGVLGKEIEEKMEESFDALDVKVDENAVLSQIFLGDDGGVAGVKVRRNGKEQTIACRALLVTDPDCLELLENAKPAYISDVMGDHDGITVDGHANVVTADGKKIPGLYGAGMAVAAALHGGGAAAALPGNELTGVLVFGITAGAEASSLAAGK